MALLRDFKYGEFSDYPGTVVKGYVTGLDTNNEGLYIFDVAAVRAQHHDKIPELTNTTEKEINIVGRDSKIYPLGIRFETDQTDPLTVEVRAWEDLPPIEDIHVVAEGLWKVINNTIGSPSDSMTGKLFYQGDPTPYEEWQKHC